MDPVEQVDGKFYTSKSQFRAVGKSLGLIEVGNEKQTNKVQRASTSRQAEEKRTPGDQEGIGTSTVTLTVQCRKYHANVSHSGHRKLKYRRSLAGLWELRTMSDVTIAPPSAAPSTSPPTNNQPTSNPPASHQVPVNENPVHTPNPVGSQAVPDKPADRDPKASIKAAFDRAASGKVAKPAERPEPKAAEAKAGHNQPPEETEKFDLKKRPGDVPRGERGQFAPRTNQQPERST